MSAPQDQSLLVFVACERRFLRNLKENYESQRILPREPNDAQLHYIQVLTFQIQMVEQSIGRAESFLHGLPPEEPKSAPSPTQDG